VTHELTPADVRAVVADFAGTVLGLQPAQVAAIDASTRLTPDGLGVDSLALLDLAAAVSTFFRLHECELEDELLRRRSVADWTATVMRAWAGGSRSITFASSGSTGVPVLCTHSWAALAQEMDAQAMLFSGRQRVLGLVGPRHIYGFLFCALLPRWLGVPFVDIRAAAPTGLASVARSRDLVVGFPMRWDLEVASGGWRSDVVATTSTGPIQASTVMALRQRGLARMVEIYGSSETGGIAWRDEPNDVLHPYAHWSLRQDGQLERVNPQTPGSKLIFEAPDILVARQQGFDVAGRRDGQVQVAGSNVSCSHVARVIEQHPEISACAVRLMRADEGARLKAFVVLKNLNEQDGVLPALRLWMRTRLSAPETPVDWVLGKALPRDTHGKLADWPARRKQLDWAQPAVVSPGPVKHPA
jgi:long-chain acyl-CoA synthetase